MPAPPQNRLTSPQGAQDQTAGMVEGPPANEQELELRKAGWRQWLQDLQEQLQDPYTGTVITQMGLQLMKDLQPGQSGQDFLARAAETGLAAGDEVRQEQFNRGVKGRELGQQDRSLDLTERGQDIQAESGREERNLRREEGEKDRSLQDLLSQRSESGATRRLQLQLQMSEKELAGRLQMSREEIGANIQMAQERLDQAERHFTTENTREWASLTQRANAAEREFIRDGWQGEQAERKAQQMFDIEKRKLELLEASSGSEVDTALLEQAWKMEEAAAFAEGRAPNLGNVTMTYWGLKEGVKGPDLKGAMTRLAEDIKTGKITPQEAATFLESIGGDASGLPTGPTEAKKGEGRGEKRTISPVDAANRFLYENRLVIQGAQRTGAKESLSKVELQKRVEEGLMRLASLPSGDSPTKQKLLEAIEILTKMERKAENPTRSNVGSLRNPIQ